MPRTARILPPNGIYHILCRGNNRQAVFREDRDKDEYLELILRFKPDHPFSLFHYCLMTNHVHLLLESNDKTNLPAFMKRLNLSYFHYFRKKYGYSGHFWQDRFKSFLVEKDSYLLACGKYIELNPVRAGMVEHPENFRHSSYSFYGRGKESKIVEPNPLYLSLSRSPKEGMRLYRNLVLPEDELKKRFTGPFWGSKEFVSRMQKRLLYKEEASREGRKVSFRKIKAE